MTFLTGILSAAQTAGVPYVGATLVLAAIGAAFGLLLYFGSKYFAVEVDPRVDEITDVLAGSNCGACGFGGCRAYAESIVLKGNDITLCAPGGQETCSAVSRIMGVDATAAAPKVAVVRCQGSDSRARSRGDYAGVKDCRAALLGGAGGGDKVCSEGCLGLGTCVAACPFDAIVMGPDGLPFVVESLCTGCGSCVAACPRDIISLHEKGQHVFVMCKSHAKGKAQKEMCDVGCIGCRKCVKACKFDAIKVTNFLAEIDDEKCKQCGACVKVCPQGTIWNVRKARKEYLKADVKSAVTTCG